MGSGANWKQSEVATLILMRREGLSAPQIATALSRPLQGVRDKAHKLGLTAPVDIKGSFFARVKKGGEQECWPWLGGGKGNGYGVANINGRKITAHRLSYLLQVGEIAGGLEVCHTCDNRWCVNPKHLFLATHLDNMRDASAKGRLQNGGINPGQCECRKQEEQRSSFRAS